LAYWGTVQLRSNPVSAVRRRASSLATGSTPGMPRQTGQTWVFGGAPNSLAQPHHILDLVLSWTCVSSPITASYSIDRFLARRTTDATEIQPGIQFRVCSLRCAGRSSRKLGQQRFHRLSFDIREPEVPTLEPKG